VWVRFECGLDSRIYGIWRQQVPPDFKISIQMVLQKLTLDVNINVLKFVC